MHKKAALYLSLIALSSFVEAKTDKKKEMCGETEAPYRATARHIEGKGIGYTKGYTSVDLFITPPPTLNTHWVPFLDTRLHIFNSGRIATNFGLGLRYLASSFVYGINSYYDYRETSHQKYNQYALGLEALGKVWDFRINGYLPLGAKFSPFYNARFGYFTDNRMVIKGNVQMAMKGLNAEAGIHIKQMDHMRFYGAFGPYYFEKRGQNAIGGKVRLLGTFFERIKIEASTSYDPIFHWIGQGELSFIFPFGPKKQISKGSSSCSKTLRLKERALQSVDRFEIPVLSQDTVYATAINPATGQPYRFVFVNNTSHSNGTYESPHHSLQDANAASYEGDVLVIFAGNETDANMDQGMTLKSGQKLWGMSVPHLFATKLGNVVVPALESSMPTISNAKSSGDVITCANDNDIEGIHIVEVQGKNGITLNDVSGMFNVVSNVIIGQNNSIGIQTTGLGSGTINILNNTFLAGDASGSSSAIWRIDGGLSSYVIDRNTFAGTTSSNGWGQTIVLISEGSSFDAVVSNNQLTSNASSSLYGIRISTSVGQTSYPIAATLMNNTLEFGTNAAPRAGIKFYVDTTHSAQIVGALQANQAFINNPGTPGVGYWFDNLSGNSSLLKIDFDSNNIGSIHNGP